MVGGLFRKGCRAGASCLPFPFRRDRSGVSLDILGQKVGAAMSGTTQNISKAAQPVADRNPLISLARSSEVP